ncbi:MAG TPA: hypothetical protein EYG11_21620 [Candidatus Latescibacteria bacterium]|nr:hypothetical protein [Candidatus Handelsmanbacteria bacterium]HIL11299.1 hypothetical protein [Candidatus Latescibacterota bacterium]
MNEDEKYLFDINGYIVVHDALSKADIALCNEAIDHHADQICERTGKLTLAGGSKALAGTTGRGDLGGALTWPEPYGQPFRNMLDNRKVAPYLHTILGEGFRLDHNLGIITMRKGAEGHTMHGSSGPGFDRHQYYIFKDGKMHNGLTVAAYQLADVNEGDGGFCLVPGSHKGNYPCPTALRRDEAYSEFVKPITCKAGDCIIFTEATTHGTRPWTSEHDRRTALFRFSPGNLAYVPHNWSEEMLALMNDEQRKVCEPPYHSRLDRPVLDLK